MERLLNVARPSCAATVSVPQSVPTSVAGETMTTVTLELSVATTLPLASSTATVTAGVIVVPARALLGCWTKASFAAV